MDLTPERLRELADDLERYEQLPDEQERASWRRVIATELAPPVVRVIRDEGYAVVEEARLADLMRTEGWGRTLRYLITPIGIGTVLGLTLWKVVDWLPLGADYVAVGLLIVLTLFWTVRELRWINDIKQRITADAERMEKLARG